MRATLGAAHLVKHQVARNFQQPGRKLCARNISARTFPNPDKDLLRDVFYVRTAAEHARNRARHQRLMLLDELLKSRYCTYPRSHRFCCKPAATCASLTEA